MAEAQKRGPRIGDAASLWNFTPAPGWTKEEAQILKLCLIKHGVGRWMQILETGLLPGKLIQQLNGQTQRLLGQQSLAAYTGLQVDIDRIRADNDKLVDAERKNGLVINSGPNLTKQQKQQMQEDAKAKYGLSEADLQEVEDQLQELLVSRGQAAAEGGAGGGAAQQEAKAGATGGVRGRAQKEVELLARDTASMSKEQKVNFLLHLHEKLQQAAARLAKATVVGSQQQQQVQQQQQGPDPVVASVAPLSSAGPPGSAENEGAVANVPMQLNMQAAAGERQQHTAIAIKPTAETAAGRAASVKRKLAGAGRRMRQATSSDDNEGDWQPQSRAIGGRGRRAAAATEAMDVDEPWWAAAVPAAANGNGGHTAAAAVALAADVQELVAMGFSAKQARDALEESSGDVEAAVEWLVANCM